MNASEERENKVLRRNIQLRNQVIYTLMDMQGIHELTVGGITFHRRDDTQSVDVSGKEGVLKEFTL